ncbi:hypothetical protein PhaeoP72_03776 (plasmid) [Phaeobacter inhibens]|nr:hypothetical protein PhaeoP72_03776 [Phaeobacter inhibens]
MVGISVMSRCLWAGLSVALLPKRSDTGWGDELNFCEEGTNTRYASVFTPSRFGVSLPLILLGSGEAHYKLFDQWREAAE